MEIAENMRMDRGTGKAGCASLAGAVEAAASGCSRYGGRREGNMACLSDERCGREALVFHNAELTGTYQKEYEGEIDAALEKDGEQYVLIVRQKETVCTLFFSRLSLEVHLFDYGKTGHFWVDGYEYLRQIEFRIAILRDKLEYLGETFCTEEEMRLGIAGQFPAAQFLLLPSRAGSVSRTVMPVVGKRRKRQLRR